MVAPCFSNCAMFLQVHRVFIDAPLFFVFSDCTKKILEQDSLGIYIYSSIAYHGHEWAMSILHFINSFTFTTIRGR